MDPHVNRALHMREQIKHIYRARLPHMGWCDDNTRRKQQVCGTKETGIPHSLHEDDIVLLLTRAPHRHATATT
jgi:hypothetical protein